MREIVLDTETTGLDARTGDRIVEIGCIELVDRRLSGREFHTYLNPETREVPAAAEQVHGLSTAFLKDKPYFRDQAPAFVAFIAEATLIIHNASFDMGFVNAELERIGLEPIGMERVVDTLAIARRKHPAGPNSLDALCKRYRIDNSKRTRHGALMDAELLCKVYLELIGERQATLGLAGRGGDAVAAERAGGARKAAQRAKPLPSRLTPEDVAAHAQFVETLGPNALWKRLRKS